MLKKQLSVVLAFSLQVCQPGSVKLRREEDTNLNFEPQIVENKAQINTFDSNNNNK